MMSDDTLGNVIGSALVLVIYAIVHLIIKKKEGKVGWKPDWVTPLILFSVLMVMTIILRVVYGPIGFMITILIAFGAVPAMHCPHYPHIPKKKFVILP